MTERRRERTLTIYRDDSTVQVVYERVKAVFWTAGNTVLVVSRYDATDGDGHHYIHWPRERFCWFKDQPIKTGEPPFFECPECGKDIADTSTSHAHCAAAAHGENAPAAKEGT